MPHKICMKKHLIIKSAEKNCSERTYPALKLPHFPLWQVKEEFMLFYYKVFRSYQPPPGLIAKMLRFGFDAFPACKAFIASGVHRASALTGR